MVKVLVARSERGRSTFDLVEAELDDPHPDEVLVRIEAVGVCYTDAEARQTHDDPIVLGHEGVGRVLAVGDDVRHIGVGQRVMLTYPHCDACRPCRTGRPFDCDHGLDLSFQGTRADGTMPITIGGHPTRSAFFQQSSFATAALARASQAVPVGEDLPASVLAAMACGVLTGAGTVVNIFRAGLDDAVVVIGAGAVGLAAVMAARLAGCRRVVAVDVHRSRLDLALDLGASHSVDASEPDAAERIRAATGGADFVLETSGRATSWDLGLEVLAMGGMLGVVTVPQPEREFAMRPHRLFERGGRLVTIIQGHAEASSMVPRLVEWYRSGRFPVDRLVSTFPFADIDRAFAASAAGVAIKPVLLVGDGAT